jgi:tetratricopeptide (TPR) repeat protein
MEPLKGCRKIITPFSSVGSPVFNEGGELVGMVLMTLDDHGGSAWVLPVERITELIKDPAEPAEFGEWAENQTISWFDTPTGSYMKGLIHYWAGDYTEALPYLELATRDNRFSREAYYLLGCCNDALQRFRKAGEAYSMAIRLNSNTSDIYVRLARTMMKEGDINGSLNCCWKALHLKLDYDAFLLLSKVYNAQGDFQKALATGHAALWMRPSSPEAYFETALAFKNMKKYSDAVRLLKRAIEISPDYERAYWHLSLTFFNSGDVDSARQTCDALRSINPDMSEKLYAEITR